MPSNERSDRYRHTPRKVFDAYSDRMEIKRQRDKEDARANLQFLKNQIKRIQLQLDELQNHVASHCSTIALEAQPNEVAFTNRGTEEL